MIGSRDRDLYKFTTCDSYCLSTIALDSDLTVDQNCRIQVDCLVFSPVERCSHLRANHDLLLDENSLGAFCLVLLKRRSLVLDNDLFERLLLFSVLFLKEATRGPRHFGEGLLTVLVLSIELSDYLL